MLSDIFSVVLTFGFGAALIVGVMGLVPYIFDFSITDEAVDVKLFRRFRIRHILLSRVAQVEVVPPWTLRLTDLLAGGEAWVNRTGRGMVVLRRFQEPDVSLTPRDAKEFAEEIRNRMSRGRHT